MTHKYYTIFSAIIIISHIITVLKIMFVHNIIVANNIILRQIKCFNIINSHYGHNSYHSLYGINNFLSGII